jgi:hypothetical protein
MGKKTAKRKFANKKSSGKWGFLKITEDCYGNTHETKLASAEVTQLYVPIGKPAPPNNPVDTATLEKWMKTRIPAQMKAAGIDPDLPYEHEIMAKGFAVPAKLDVAQNYRKYTQNAIDFALTKIPNLKNAPFEYILVKKGQNFTKNYAHRAFIAHSHYTAYRIDFKLRGEHVCCAYTPAKHSHGSYLEFNMKSEQGSMATSWHLFFSTGKTAINAPFSEFIPFTTAPASIKKIPGNDKARKFTAEETISESIAYLLAKEFVGVAKIPDGLARLENARTIQIASDSSYRYVDRAIDWIKSHSIQDALGMYLDNPLNFMRTVQSFSGRPLAPKEAQLWLP